MARCQICNCCPETGDPSEYWNGAQGSQGSGMGFNGRSQNTNIDYTAKTYRGMGTNNFQVKYRRSVDQELCSRCWQGVKDNKNAYEWIDKNKEMLIEPDSEELREDAFALSEV